MNEKKNILQEMISKHIFFVTLILTIVLHCTIFLIYINGKGKHSPLVLDVSNEKQAIEFIEKIKKEIHNIPKPQRDIIVDGMKQILNENQDSTSPFMDDVKH